MKKLLCVLLFTAMAVSFSSCSADNASPTTTTIISVSETTSTSITESVTENEVTHDETNKGFVFYDYTGEEVDTENVSCYTLNYAMGWQAFGGETLHKIDNTTVINSMAVTDVYSEYSVFPTRDGYGANYCKGGYSLVSAEDAFKGISVKGILHNNGTNWILKIIREETDEYFYDISLGGTLKQEEAEINSTITAGGQTFNVQPMEIIIRNADEFDEIENLDINSVYVAELTLEVISFSAYAQDAADSPATLLTAVTFLKNVNFFEELSQGEFESSDIDLINYTGDRIVDKIDFEIFEKFFYGKWIDRSGTAPEDVELYYSGNTFSLGYYNLVDIYADENSAYLVITVVGETTIYVIDFDAPNTMYEYYETNHGGRPKNQPDFIYTKTSVSEEDSLGFFGILKQHYVDDIPVDVLASDIL